MEKIDFDGAYYAIVGDSHVARIRPDHFPRGVVQVCGYGGADCRRLKHIIARSTGYCRQIVIMPGANDSLNRRGPSMTEFDLLDTVVDLGKHADIVTVVYPFDMPNAPKTQSLLNALALSTNRAQLQTTSFVDVIGSMGTHPSEFYDGVHLKRWAQQRLARYLESCLYEFSRDEEPVPFTPVRTSSPQRDRSPPENSPSPSTNVRPTPSSPPLSHTEVTEPRQQYATQTYVSHTHIPRTSRRMYDEDVWVYPGERNNEELKEERTLIINSERRKKKAHTDNSRTTEKYYRKRKRKRRPHPKRISNRKWDQKVAKLELATRLERREARLQRRAEKKSVASDLIDDLRHETPTVPSTKAKSGSHLRRTVSKSLRRPHSSSPPRYASTSSRTPNRSLSLALRNTKSVLIGLPKKRSYAQLHTPRCTPRHEPRYYSSGISLPTKRYTSCHTPRHTSVYTPHHTTCHIPRHSSLTTQRITPHTIIPHITSQHTALYTRHHKQPHTQYPSLYTLQQTIPDTPRHTPTDISSHTHTYTPLRDAVHTSSGGAPNRSRSNAQCPSSSSNDPPRTPHGERFSDTPLRTARVHSSPTPGPLQNKLLDIQSTLLMRSGDIESNPGPGTKSGTHTEPIGGTCLFCSKEKSEKNRRTGIRTKSRLINCTESSLVSITKAAKLAENVEIQNYIQVNTLNRIKYHCLCYKTFMNRLRIFKTERFNQRFIPTWEIFQKVITDRLIEKREILRFKTLQRIFKKTAKTEQHTNATSYCRCHLKSQIQQRYPNMIFAKSSHRNTEIVYCVTVNDAKSHSDMEVDSSDICTDSDTDDDSPMVTDGSGDGSPQTDDTRILYHAAMILKSAMNDCPRKALAWPPTAADLNMKTALSIIPTQLMLFLAWTAGVSDDPTVDIETLSTKSLCKLASLSQDILYLACNGGISLPKHISLGLTVRHITGCTRLIDTLNGYGHCVSEGKVLEHDTGLTELEIARSSEDVPDGATQTFTTLVWDNNDFSEETLSGKKTTHNTNGILIQTGEAAPSHHISIPKSGKRSITPPDINIAIPSVQVLKKTGPLKYDTEIDTGEDKCSPNLESSIATDIALTLTRLQNARVKNVDPYVPSWTGYNTLLSKCTVQKSRIHYLPVIDASPTEMSTINTIICKSVTIANVLQQESIVVVCDQAVYHKIQQIRWNHEEYQQRLVVRLGVFHTCMAFLSCIGKRFSKSGLEDILVDSELVAQGSLNGVISGHMYNRALRSHKLLGEAFDRLRWLEFYKSLTPIKQTDVDNVVSQLSTLFPEKEHVDYIHSDDFMEIKKEYQSYIKEQSVNNPTYQYWSSYVDMVRLLLSLIRATRTGDWRLHLSAIRSIIPWFFAYDHTNYSRYLPAYWLEMTCLGKTHPRIEKEFENGKFAVFRTESHSFSGIAADQTIEQTMNRDTKTKGGMIGFSNNPGSVHRWILSHHHRANIQINCENMSGKHEKAMDTVKDLHKSRISGDQYEIERVCETVESMFNPFEDKSPDLYNVSSGAVAGKDMTNDILTALSVGQQDGTNFFTERLQGDDKAFHDPIKQRKLLTFAKTQTTKSSKNTNVPAKDGQCFLAKLLIISQTRDIDLEDILQHNLQIIPPQLSTLSGEITKTNKCTLMKHLEGLVETPKDVTFDSSVLIIDGMALFHEMHPSHLSKMTFGQFSYYVLKNIIQRGVINKASTVHFITDTYPSISIKSAERIKRTAAGQQRIKIKGEGQNLPAQWRKYIANEDNKTELVKFLFDMWQGINPILLQNICLIFDHGNECHAFTDQSNQTSNSEFVTVEKLPELCTSQEEADTKIILHCQHSSIKEHKPIIINSPDTDVFILAIAFCGEMQSDIYMLTGSGCASRMINITQILQQIGPSVAHSLIGLHCFTGCDSVSSFFGRSKVRAYKIMTANESFLNACSILGDSFSISDSTVHQLEVLLCRLYCSNTTSVNMLRYEMFCEDQKEEKLLPPNRDSLIQHIKRSNYQAAIYKRALTPTAIIESPAGHGWEIKEGSLYIKWGTLPPAPATLTNIVKCGCKKGKCTSKLCKCFSGEFSCTDMCKCSNCENAIPL